MFNLKWTKPFRFRRPEVKVALKAVSKFTRNKLFQRLEVGCWLFFFWIVLILSFQEQELSARTQALQAASASCSFRPNGFDDNDPPGSCGPTGGGGGGGFSTVGRLVFWLWRQPGIHWFQSSPCNDEDNYNIELCQTSYQVLRLDPCSKANVGVMF